MNRPATVLPASIPSPAQGVWHLGPFPVRAYALCIIAGIVAALILGERRWTARGGAPGQVADLAFVVVPAGIIGGRLYHVLTDPELYFAPGRSPVRALYIWDGGLGIWGAVALGAAATWWCCRRAGIDFAAFADAIVPGVALAQALGRWGNWFNQELFGAPTHLPWALRITHPADGNPPGLYHPTFLYESLWDLGVVGLLIWAERRFALDRGRVVALYVAAYTTGRLWIEALRVDHANRILGLRLNIWTCLILFTASLVYLVLCRTQRDPRRPFSAAAGTPRAGGPA